MYQYVYIYIYIYIYIYCFVSQAIQEEQNGIPGFILQVLDHKKGLYLTCGGKKLQYSGTCFVICCLLKLLKWNYVPILQKNNEEQHLIQNITVYSFYTELQYYVWEMHYFYRETLCLFSLSTLALLSPTGIFFEGIQPVRSDCLLVMTSFLSWILIREARLFAYRRSVVCISSPSGALNNTHHFPHGSRKEKGTRGSTRSSETSSNETWCSFTRCTLHCGGDEGKNDLHLLMVPFICISCLRCFST